MFLFYPLLIYIFYLHILDLVMLISRTMLLCRKIHDRKADLHTYLGVWPFLPPNCLFMRAPTFVRGCQAFCQQFFWQRSIFLISDATSCNILFSTLKNFTKFYNILCNTCQAYAEFKFKSTCHKSKIIVTYFVFTP